MIDKELIICTLNFNSLRTWINACNWKIVAHLSLEATSYRGHKFDILVEQQVNSLYITITKYITFPISNAKNNRETVVFDI